MLLGRERELSALEVCRAAAAVGRGLVLVAGEPELFEDLGEAAYRAGEPVDAVDEQQVEPNASASLSARWRPGRSSVAPEAWSLKRRTTCQSSWLRA